MNKKMRRLLSFVLSMILLLSAPVGAVIGLDGGLLGVRSSAVSKESDGADFNTSYKAVTGSYDSTDLPKTQEVFFSGETFYINFHAGKDIYIKKWSIVVSKIVNGSIKPYKTYSMSRKGYGAYGALKLSGLTAGDYMYGFRMEAYHRSDPSNVEKTDPEDEAISDFVVLKKPTISSSPSSITMNKNSTNETIRVDYEIDPYELFNEKVRVDLVCSYTSSAFTIKQTNRGDSKTAYLVVYPNAACSKAKVDIKIVNRNNNDAVLASCSCYITIVEATHTVTYDYSTNGGSSSTKQKESYSKGASVDLSVKATKSGWTFVGWNTDRDATSKLSSYTMGEQDITLYAIYKKTIKAKFVDYSTTTKRTRTEEATIYNKEKSVRISPPSQGYYAGWSDRGWTTSTSASASPTSNFTLSADETYYGLYERTVWLSYNANGGNSTPSAASGSQYMNSYRLSSKKNPSFTLASGITRDGYAFKKWAKGSASGAKYSAGSSITISEDTTMYATWEAVPYTVTYDYYHNGGSQSTKSSAKVNWGDSIDLSPTATKDGWTFVGWNTDRSAQTKISSLKMKDSDVTLYAIFKKTITATFVDYSGTSKRSTEKKQTIYNNADSATFSAPHQGTYSDWLACGWSTETAADASRTNDYVVSENSTFYGLYKKPVTLKYNANGGDSVPSAVKDTRYANSYNISDTKDPLIQLAPAIRKSGVSFLGWAKDSKTGMLYNEGEDFRLTKNTTMYAAFSSPKHTHSWSKPSWKWDGQTASAEFQCKTCGQKQVVQASVKIKVDKRATTEENGKRIMIASAKHNGKVYQSRKTLDKIYRIKTVKLAKTKYTYNGEKKTPKVIVNDTQGNQLKKDKDYKIKYSSGRTECKTYKVTVTFLGKYAGTAKLSFKIELGKVTGLKQKRAKGFKISWNPVVGADYYEVYCLDSQAGKFRMLKGDCSATTIHRSDLTNRTLRFKVRAVRNTSEGKTVKGAFSDVLTAKA